MEESLPDGLREAVLKKQSASTDDSQHCVRGFDFQGCLEASQAVIPVTDLMSSYATMGFQATHLNEGMQILREMLERRRYIAEHPSEFDGKPFRLFLGYTSNMVSCGNRECLRFIVQNGLVDAIVTTAGGIEEDFIKCLKPTRLLPADEASGGYKDALLREQGLNRINNLVVPNENYCAFEDWLVPILDKMCTERRVWTPSQLIARLGQEIQHEDSIYYWAWRNNIPVYCPALTDGSLGDMLFFHSYRQNPETTLILDILPDLRHLNLSAIHSSETGIFVLGGGLVKHHIANANLMRNGAEWAVFVNTAVEYDGSDAGAGPGEAISWGKLRKGARAVKVHAEASLVLPLITATVFYPEAQKRFKKRSLEHLYI